MIGATMIESAERGAVTRALGDRTAERRLCAAPGLWRGGDRRNERRRAPRLSRQRAAHRRARGDGLSSTASTAMASCCRRPSPSGRPAMAILTPCRGIGDEAHRQRRRARDSSAATLAAALEALDYGDAMVATALNGEFVAGARARGHAAQDGRPDRDRRAAAGRLRCAMDASVDERRRLRPDARLLAPLLGTSQYPSPAILAEAVRAAAPISSRCRCGANWRG